jgi:Domain of unknown function (DUF4082)/VPDSG-CTERM motif
MNNSPEPVCRRLVPFAIALAIALVALVGTQAQADALYSSVGSGFNRDDTTATVGVYFTADSTIVITELGFIDNNLDGNNISHQVGLWTFGGTLLGSVTIPSGSSATLIGSFRYEPLVVPITLISGQSYVLGAYVQNGDGDVWQDSGVSYALGLPVSNVAAAYYNSTPAFAYPNNIFPGDANPYIGPNMLQAVPDSGSTLGLLFLALMTLLGANRLGSPRSA